MPNKCPIFLFAFANDDGRSLRQLDEEQKALRKIFLQAEKEGACEVRILVAATEQDVAEAFQEYWGRVRIFHYGGHSDEKELFFRSNNKQSAEASSLADFLALQEGLELVF
ncbi:MAG: hypothetical protein J5I94_14605, partial [Phaeodactylibacter sp.]|nr:hypothetical protein [Phaeodactylibacter sp.]